MDSPLAPIGTEIYLNMLDSALLNLMLHSQQTALFITRFVDYILIIFTEKVNIQKAKPIKF